MFRCTGESVRVYIPFSQTSEETLAQENEIHVLNL